MSLQKRLLLFLLISAPLVWALAAFASVNRTRHEVDELVDTEIIRLARQVQSTLSGLQTPRQPLPPAAGASGEADLRDLAIAVWDAQGQLLLVDHEGAQLPRRADAACPAINTSTIAMPQCDTRPRDFDSRRSHCIPATRFTPAASIAALEHCPLTNQFAPPPSNCSCHPFGTLVSNAEVTSTFTFTPIKSTVSVLSCLSFARAI